MMFEKLPTFEEVLTKFVAVHNIDKNLLRELYRDLKNSREEVTTQYINEMHGAN